MTEPLDDVWAALTIRDYVCSNCWGHLEKYPTDGRMWLVKCPRCEEQTKGYVTKYYAEQQRGNSQADLSDAKGMLKQLGIIPDPMAGKTAKDILSDLGF